MLVSNITLTTWMKGEIQDKLPCDLETAEEEFNRLISDPKEEKKVGCPEVHKNKEVDKDRKPKMESFQSTKSAK